MPEPGPEPGSQPPTSGPVPPGPLVQIRSYARPTIAPTDHSTQRVSLRPIAAWRMDDSRFEFDASFIKPIAREELDELAALHRARPSCPISIFAHTDPVGDDGYNKPLSGRRALALYALLVRDVDEWEALYTSPMAGDQWGTRSVQHMLGALRDSQGQPYYGGDVDGQYGSGTSAAVVRWQEDNDGVDGAPLDVDGIAGPATRKSLYRAYMDHLCTDDEGRVLTLDDAAFLARGADPEHRGDVQGCGEHNPLMVFSTAEHAKYQAWAHRDERNRENSVNRRAVVFFYPDGVRVHPDRWPCPAAKSDHTRCRERFWSDAQTRRAPSESRRHFDGDFDTFACRFYHHFGINTPAETPVHLGRTLDVHLHHGDAGPGPGRFRLQSDDGTVDVEKTTGDAVALAGSPGRELRILSFTLLPSSPRYTLSFSPDDADLDPIVLMESFVLGALGSAASDGDALEYSVREDFDAVLHEGLPALPDLAEDDPAADTPGTSGQFAGLNVVVHDIDTGAPSHG